MREVRKKMKAKEKKKASRRQGTKTEVTEKLKENNKIKRTRT